MTFTEVDRMIESLPKDFKPAGGLVLLCHPSSEVAKRKRYKGIKIETRDDCPRDNAYLMGKDNWLWSKAFETLQLIDLDLDV